MAAKWEREGYCPYHSIDFSGNEHLAGMWSLICDSVVYENKTALGNTPDTITCDKIFSTDPIAYDVLSAIIRKNVNASKIMVHQIYNQDYHVMRISDLPKSLTVAPNHQLIAHGGSNFIVIITDAPYGIDVWVWDILNF